MLNHMMAQAERKDFGNDGGPMTDIILPPAFIGGDAGFRPDSLAALLGQPPGGHGPMQGQDDELAFLLGGLTGNFERVDPGFNPMLALDNLPLGFAAEDPNNYPPVDLGPNIPLDVAPIPNLPLDVTPTPKIPLGPTFGNGPILPIPEGFAAPDNGLSPEDVRPQLGFGNNGQAFVPSPLYPNDGFGQQGSFGFGNQPQPGFGQPLAFSPPYPQQAPPGQQHQFGMQPMYQHNPHNDYM